MNYTLKSKLGEGGMATVHLAEDPKFKADVAIKILNKELVHNEHIRKRFIAEARSMFRMSHPHVIKVTDLIDEEDTVAFVMEYVEGETLKDYLDRKGKLTDAEIKNIFSQMLDAVGYVQEQKLIHRDIKPSNFLLDKKGQVKLMDFGIAKNTDPNAAEYTLTGTGIQMGTPMYMSPEQITETKSVTTKSDIYSLGVMLWQMVTGLKPYDPKKLSTFQLQIKIVQEPLGITNSHWDGLIQKATKKDGSNRYLSCADFKIDLDRPHKKQKSKAEGSGLTQNEDKTVLEQVALEKRSRPTKPKKSVSKPLAQSEKVELQIPKENSPNWTPFIKVGLVLFVAALIFGTGRWIILQLIDDDPDEGIIVENPISDIPSDAVSGDFNGDGTLDYMLIQKPELASNNEECVGDCISYIKFSDPSIPEIEVPNSIGGTPSNLGDLNGNGTDEIGLLPDSFSSCWREYFVWTFTNQSWGYLVDPISTHCNQWEDGIRPIEIDPSRSGNVIIRYSELDDDLNIVTRSKSINLSNPNSQKREKGEKSDKREKL
jgi:serine/threonine protein kinase